jgi:hypothetical protein
MLTQPALGADEKFSECKGGKPFLSLLKNITLGVCSLVKKINQIKTTRYEFVVLSGRGFRQ